MYVEYTYFGNVSYLRLQENRIRRLKKVVKCMFLIGCK